MINKETKNQIINRELENLFLERGSEVWKQMKYLMLSVDKLTRQNLKLMMQLKKLKGEYDKT